MKKLLFVGVNLFNRLFFFQRVVFRDLLNILRTFFRNLFVLFYIFINVLNIFNWVRKIFFCFLWGIVWDCMNILLFVFCLYFYILLLSLLIHLLVFWNLFNFFKPLFWNFFFTKNVVRSFFYKRLFFGNLIVLFNFVTFFFFLLILFAFILILKFIFFIIL